MTTFLLSNTWTDFGGENFVIKKKVIKRGGFKEDKWLKIKGKNNGKSGLRNYREIKLNFL